MAQTLVTNHDMLNFFIDDLLLKSFEKSLIAKPDVGVYMTQADGEKFDELRRKEKLIVDKIQHYQKQKRKVRQMLVLYKKKNLRLQLFDILKSKVIDMISTGAFSKLLETNFSDSKSFDGLVAQINHFCDQHTHFDISDAEEKFLNSEEEQMLASTKRPKSQRRKKNLKKPKTDYNVTDVSSAELVELSDSSSDDEAM